MNYEELFFPANEKPLDRLVHDGGFVGIFRTIACVGDSLSSGEFETVDENGVKHYHDLYDYSWGQYIARAAGCKVYNFSRGGMTAKEYMEGFAAAKGFWQPQLRAQAYIIALGVNDLFGRKQDVGSVEDIDFADWRNNKPTFTGWYAQVIQRYKEIEPDAKFFLMTMPRKGDENDAKREQHRETLIRMAEAFDNCYIIDLYTYGPVYDEKFNARFNLHGHMNPCGYILTAQMTISYIDYIIRHNMNDFRYAGLISSGLVDHERDERET